MPDNARLTPQHIREMLEAVQSDREAKKAFLDMSKEEQLLAMLGMISFTNNQIASLQRNLLSYRNEREKKEKAHNGSLEDTGARIAQGIKRELEGQFGPVYWFRDKVLPGVVTAITTAIVLAVLYLTFGPK